MSKQKKPKQQERQVMTGLERLGLRVSAMIGSPRAQLERRVTIHQMETDEEGDWDSVMALLAETDGLSLAFNDDDGTVTVTWEKAEDDEGMPGEGVVEAEETAPF